MEKKYYKTGYIYLIFLIGVFSLNFLGAFVTKSNLMPWYQHLIKPNFNPPSWVFGPVWTFLYIVIAWVGAYAWLLPKSFIKTKLLSLWFGQMFLNFIWSFLFFGWHQILLAAVDLSCLIVVVGLLTASLYKVNTLGFYGFCLYLAWISYAGVLNWSIYGLN